jgi:hypothetical protein
MILSPLGQPDKLVWMGNSSGCFSVKSVYHMEMSKRLATRGESSNSQENSEVWGLIWYLEGPGVLKHFVWKFCSNALPTKENLCRQKIKQDPLCPLCSSSTEDIWHALWSCPAAVAVWQDCPHRLQKLSLQESDGLRLFQ